MDYSGLFLLSGCDAQQECFFVNGVKRCIDCSDPDMDGIITSEVMTSCTNFVARKCTCISWFWSKGLEY